MDTVDQRLDREALSNLGLGMGCQGYLMYLNLHLEKCFLTKVIPTVSEYSFPYAKRRGTGIEIRLFDRIVSTELRLSAIPETSAK